MVILGILEDCFAHDGWNGTRGEDEELSPGLGRSKGSRAEIG